MKRLSTALILSCAALTCAAPASADIGEFSFGFIPNSFRAAADESLLRDALVQSDADSLAFVVTNGIKASAEPCSDKLYEQRQALIDDAKNGIIVSVAGTDWSDCRYPNGRTAAIERLNRIRELFFSDELSLGTSKIPVTRQSTTRKFRSYVENARWDIGDIVFATINLPANNNHYLTEAGRNSEFEDRLTANRDWLQRIFVFAANKKSAGIVLFCDGNPLLKPRSLPFFESSGKRDGFAETRRLLTTLATKFHGKVLIVHGSADQQALEQNGISWQNNLGDLTVAGGWAKVTVQPSTPTLFVERINPIPPKAASQPSRQAARIGPTHVQ